MPAVEAVRNLMWKQRAKYVAAALAERAGLWALMERMRRDTWSVVCYHRVLPAEQRGRYFCPDLAVTPESLRAHCQVYRDHFTVVTVAEGFRRLAAGGKISKPLLSISFDDGYQDNFAYAAPILNEHGLAGTFFVIAGLANTEELPWYDKMALEFQRHSGPSLGADSPLRAIVGQGVAAQGPEAAARAIIEALKRLPDAERRRVVDALPVSVAPGPLDRIMDAAQLRALRAQGHEIGSHSYSHPILPLVAPEARPRELQGARERLEALSGGPVETFCYPNGDFTSDIATETRRAGYNCAVSTRQGVNRQGEDVMALARIFVHEDWLSAPGGLPSRALLRAELALLHRVRH